MYLFQETSNPYTKNEYIVTTTYNDKMALYETNITFFTTKLVTVTVQRYKMRTEAIRGHNSWLYTLRQEEFALRDVDTAELYWEV